MEYIIENPLILACEQGDTNIVKQLIDQGFDIETRDDYGDTPLISASRNGHLNIVEYLIDVGADINATNQYGYTSLIFASKDGYLEIVKYLIQNGIEIDSANNYGTTSLMMAIREGHFEIVKYLVKSGAYVSCTNHFGFDAISSASYVNKWEMSKYMIEYGYIHYSVIEDQWFFKRILKDETNNLKSILTNIYMTLEKSNPRFNIGNNIKYKLPKNLLLKIVYETTFQELCNIKLIGSFLMELTKPKQKKPPIRLIALANILKIDYDIDFSHNDLCDKIKSKLYSML